MFIDMKVLERAAAAACKYYKLRIGNVDGQLTVHTGEIAVGAEVEWATNAYKSLIVEYIGEIPEPGEIYRIGREAGAQREVGFEDLLNIRKKYSRDMPRLSRTKIRLDDWRIYQDELLVKYAVPEKLDQAFKKEKELEDIWKPRLGPRGESVVYHSDEMTMQIAIALPAATDPVFKSLRQIDLDEENCKAKENEREADDEE